MSENQKKTKQIGAINTDEKPSHLSGAILFLLCAMLVFSVVAFGAVDVWALGAAALLAGSIAVCWLTDAWRNKDFRFNASALQIPLLALILIGIIQLLPLRRADFPNDLLSVSAVSSLSLAPYSTRLAIVQLIVYFIFFAAALTFINNYSRLRKVILTIIIFGSLMAFYGILQHLANPEAIYNLRFPNQAAVFASFINKHHFAAFMELTLGVTLGLLFGKATENNKRIFLMIAIVIMGVALILTNSRGGMLSLLGVIAFVVAANVLRKPTSEIDSPIADGKSYLRNFAFIGGGLALILVLFGTVLLLGGDDSLLRAIGLQNPKDDISNGRLHFWQIALRIFFDYPILGAGLDAFATAFTRYDSWNGMYRVEQAHNDYLQTLADAGVLGFACVTAFIYLLFKKGLQTIRESSDRFRRSAAVGALAGCFGILIHSFFDFPLRTPSNAFFFLILTVLATASISPPQVSRKLRPRILTE
ncbi:MAG: O-antigen ligase family protein [Acidobacteriota bacterium]|nr:O-antigen ligase family protein [Acidobacteriota bacterium]